MAKTVNDIAPGGAIVAAGSVPNRVPGDRKRTFRRITGDNNYQAGGYPIAPADLGFAYQIDYLKIINDASAPGGLANVSWYWNTATQSLQLIVVSTGAELANGQNASALTCDVEAEGR
jgi:hypothetical protein